MQLVRPRQEHLPGYLDTLDRGWSPDPVRRGHADAERRRIESDATTYLARMDDREALGAPITLPDGSSARRIPSIRRWLWDGKLCGTISLRWQPGTTALEVTGTRQPDKNSRQQIGSRVRLEAGEEVQTATYRQARLAA
jgi:predicted acetyltransferase